MGDPVISLVVAAAENGVIGRSGALPWRLKSELRHFRRLTMGHPLVMGRKTFESIGGPLEGRDNIVVSRSRRRFEGAAAADSLEGALAMARLSAERRGVNEIFVIGGAEIFAAALPVATRIHFTRVHAAPEGDAFFADPDPAVWREVARTPSRPAAGDDCAYSIVTLERDALTLWP
jgi:dihydrofolate reductase